MYLAENLKESLIESIVNDVGFRLSLFISASPNKYEIDYDIYEYLNREISNKPIIKNIDISFNGRF